MSCYHDFYDLQRLRAFMIWGGAIEDEGSDTNTIVNTVTAPTTPTTATNAADNGHLNEAHGPNTMSITA